MEPLPSPTCPKCGWAREPGAVECPACGIVYARYRDDLDAPPPDDGNPYAPPRSDLQGDVAGQVLLDISGVWRSGDLLVLKPEAFLPDWCLVCNEPADVRFPKNLYWHHPAISYLLLLNRFLYAVVALFAMKKVRVELPLCTRHFKKRQRWATFAALLIITGVPVLAASVTRLYDRDGSFQLLVLIGGFIVCAGLVTLQGRATNPAPPARLTDDHIWLRNVHPSYLRRLPTAPPGL